MATLAIQSESQTHLTKNKRNNYFEEDDCLEQKLKVPKLQRSDIDENTSNTLNKILSAVSAKRSLGRTPSTELTLSPSATQAGVQSIHNDQYTSKAGDCGPKTPPMMHSPVLPSSPRQDEPTAPLSTMMRDAVSAREDIAEDTRVERRPSCSLNTEAISMATTIFSDAPQNFADFGETTDFPESAAVSQVDQVEAIEGIDQLPVNSEDDYDLRAPCDWRERVNSEEAETCPGEGVTGKKEKSVKVKKIFLRMLRKVLNIPSYSPLLRVWRGARTAKNSRKQISAGWYGIEVMDVEDVDLVLGKLLPDVDTTIFNSQGPWEILAGILQCPVKVASSYASLKKGRYRLNPAELPPDVEGRVVQLQEFAHALHIKETDLENERMGKLQLVAVPVGGQCQQQQPSPPVDPSSEDEGQLSTSKRKTPTKPSLTRCPAIPTRSRKAPRTSPPQPATSPLHHTPTQDVASMSGSASAARPPSHPTSRRGSNSRMAPLMQEFKKSLLDQEGSRSHSHLPEEPPLVGVPVSPFPVGMAPPPPAAAQPVERPPPQMDGLTCLLCSGPVPCSCEVRAGPSGGSQTREPMEAEFDRAALVGMLGQTLQHCWVATKHLDYNMLVEMAVKMNEVMTAVVPVIESKATEHKE